MLRRCVTLALNYQYQTENCCSLSVQVAGVCVVSMVYNCRPMSFLPSEGSDALSIIDGRGARCKA